MNDYSLELQEQMMNQLEEMQTKIENYKQRLSESDMQRLRAVEQAEQCRMKMNEVREELEQLRENVSLNEKKTNISVTEKSICPFKHCIAAANARPTLPHLSVSRCRALAGT